MSFANQSLENSSILVTIEEARLDAALAPKFKDYACSLFGESGTNLILDISKVEFMDSSGLGALVSVLKTMNGQGSIKLVGVQSLVEDLLRLTRMDRIFSSYETVEAASQEAS